MYGPSVIPLPHTVWIVVGCVLVYWIFVPAAFFTGLAAWPGSFREFNEHGGFYNNTEGHYNRTLIVIGCLEVLMVLEYHWYTPNISYFFR